MSTSPFRATVDITGEQWTALDELARRTGRSRNSLIRAALDLYLAPAEAGLSTPDPVVPPSTDHGEKSPASAGAKGRAKASGGRPFLTDAQVAEMRERRAAGESLHSLARAFNVSHVSVLKRVGRMSRWCEPPANALRGLG